jgi:undecaprenyl-diphosphatase
MELFQAAILGIIEGITEFLPISSTGHLIIASSLLGLEQDSITKAFEVIIQLASILAVVILYKDRFSPKNIELWKKVLVAFLPLLIVGYIFKDYIKELFSINIVATMFIIGGIVFIIVERFYDEDRIKVSSIDEIGYKEAFFIGIAQLFALIPGTSRAGSTIIGGLLCKLSRKASAEFSFLLALPVMSATSGYDLLKHYDEFTSNSALALLVGFVVSFVVAYIVIKLFLAFLERWSFVAFGIYRIIFGIILLILY